MRILGVNRHGVTKEDILKLYIYDRKNGKLILKDQHRIKVMAKIAGYRLVKVNGYAHGAHRLIWFLETGEWPRMVDHIDGDIANNHISNLREVTSRENSQNSHLHRGGKLVGAYYLKSRGKWVSRAHINGKKKYLGYFNTELEAHLRYKKEVGLGQNTKTNKRTGSLRK